MAHFFINNLLIVKFLKDLKLVSNKLKKNSFTYLKKKIILTILLFFLIIMYFNEKSSENSCIIVLIIKVIKYWNKFLELLQFIDIFGSNALTV